MSNPFQLIRKYQTAMLVFFGVILMAIFGLGPAFDYIGRQGLGGIGNDMAKTLVKYKDGSLTRGDVELFRKKHFQTQNFVSTLVEKAGENAGQTVPELLTIFPTDRFGQEFSDRTTVEAMLMVERAQKEGIVVGDSAVAAFLDAASGGKVNEAQQAAMLKNTYGGSFSLNELKKHLKKELAAINYEAMLHAGTGSSRQRFGFNPPSPIENWMSFNRLYRKAVCDAMPISVEDHVKDVSDIPTKAEIEKLYEEGKAEYPDPSHEKPGFRTTSKARLSYFTVDQNLIIDKLKRDIPDEDVQELYETYKQEKNPLVIEQAAADEEESGSEEGTETGKAAESGKESETGKAGDESTDSETKKNAKPDGGKNTEEEKTEEKRVDEPGAADKEKADEKKEPSADDSKEGSAAKEKPKTEEPKTEEPKSEEPSTEAKPAESTESKESESKSDDSSDSEGEGDDCGFDPAQDDEAGKDEAGKDVAGKGEADKDVAGKDKDGKDGKDVAGKDKDGKVKDDADAASDSDATGESDSKATAGQPSATPPEGVGEKEIKFKPLDEKLADQLREKMIVRDDAFEAQYTDAQRACIAEIEEHKMLIDDWEYDKENGEPGAAQPEEPDFDSVAAANFATFGDTEELMTYQEFSKHKFGSRIVGTGNSGVVRVADYAFQNFLKQPLLQPITVDAPRFTPDMPGISYVMWYTDKEEPHIPTLEEARDAIVEFWQYQKGLENARTEAERIAEEVRESKKTLEASYPDKATSLGQFTWLSSQRGGFGEPAKISSIFPMLDEPGEEFMETVFSMKQGEVGVASDANKDNVFVIQLMSIDNNEEALRNLYFTSPIVGSTAMQASNDAARGIVNEQREKMLEDLELEWMD